MPNVILVTGGTGLVGSGLAYTLENEAVGSRFGKATEDEVWHFVRSSDADLR